MEMEPKQWWVWEKNKKLTSLDDKPSSYGHESWEEQAFAKDAGGCVWPPRSYSCSFCKREFRSAQALGGHMNVHRRDRARLKHESLQPHLENLQIPAKNSPFTFSSSDDLQHPSQLDLEETERRAKLARNPIILHKLFQNSDFSTMRNDLRSPQKHPATANLTGGKEDAIFCKRKRTDSQSVAFFLQSNDYVKSEVHDMSPTSGDDLDLELRLGGGRPKPKLK